MAPLGRYFLPEQPQHVIQRGNNRQPIFLCDDDYVRYRDWLIAAAAEQGCSIHAYALMTNHVHILVTPKRAESLPRMSRSAVVTSVTSTSRIGAPARCGRGATGRRRSTARPIFSGVLPLHRAQSGACRDG